jgi:hypothetical protein
MHTACQLWLGLALVGCGSDIKPLTPPDSGDGTAVDSGGAGAGDGGEGAGDDGAEGGDGADGGAGGGGRVEVEYTVSWVTRVEALEVCSATLVVDDAPTSWGEWGVWTDIDPALEEPAPDPLPDPISANVPVGQGTSAGHGSWRFSLDASSDASFPAYAALAEAGGDHRLVCVLARGSEAIPHSLVDLRPLPELDDPLESVDVLLRVIWSD